MKIGLVAKISVALNVGTLLFFIGKRYFFPHNQPVVIQNPIELWNQARKSVLGPLPIDTTDIVFVGNSITEGFPLQEMFHSLKVKNRGIGGNRSCHILGRIEGIARARPAKIFLDIGVNDILNHVPLDTLKTHYQIILNNIWGVSPYTKIYVQSVFPLGRSHAAEEKMVETFNAWLKDFCDGANITYLDLFSAYYKDGLLNPDYTYDDIHLNGLGYEVWKRKVEEFL